MTKDKPGRDPVSSDKWKLTRTQRKYLLTWIGEGLKPREINSRASKLKSPFQATRQLIDYYRKKTGKKVVEERKAEDISSFSKGFALKEKRVEALNAIAELLFEDITKPDRKGLWLEDRKAIGSGPFAETFDFEKFNQAEIQELRAVFEDIAKEVGDRLTGKKIGIELPDGGEGEDSNTYKFYIGIDPDKV